MESGRIKVKEKIRSSTNKMIKIKEDWKIREKKIEKMEKRIDKLQKGLAELEKTDSRREG